MDTQHFSRFKGTAGEYIAMAALTLRGYMVYSFIVSEGDVDIIVEKEGRLLRVQAKTFYLKNGRKVASLDKSRNKEDRAYSEKDIDAFVFVDVETAECFWMDMPIKHKSGISKATVKSESIQIYPLITTQEALEAERKKSTSGYHNYSTKPHSTRYKGVSYARAKKKYRAQISVGGNRRHIGYYDTPEEAAKAYDSEAINLGVKNPYLNFPEQELNQEFI